MTAPTADRHCPEDITLTIGEAFASVLRTYRNRVRLALERRREARDPPPQPAYF